MRSIVRNGAKVRSGTTFAYGYNNANRLKTVTSSGNLLGTPDRFRRRCRRVRGRLYTYKGFEQLIKRVITNSGAANGTAHTVHDVFGNVIAELDAAGATVREYIWLPEAEIAPTMGSRTTVDRPMAVVSGVNTTPTLLMVHVDHLHRPVKMTNAAGASVWSAVWLPWGGAHAITGAEINDARFPGQWFQLEAGLHYNWHRAYDPSLGRYTQPDPLGFVDGPSVYAYARSAPTFWVDPFGLYTEVIVWDPRGYGKSSQGHLSVDIDGKNYSFGEDGWDKKYPSTSEYIKRNTEFRSGMGYVLDLTPDEERQLAQCMSQWRGNWTPFNNNCTTPIQDCLNEIGLAPPAPSTTPSSLGNVLRDWGLTIRQNIYPQK